MGRIPVVLVDDEYLILENLKNLIDWDEAGFQIVAVAQNGKAALDLIARHRPLLVITDVSMPVMDGIELTERIQRDYPDTQVLVYTSYAEFQYIRQAMQYGAIGYLLKNEISAGALSDTLSALRDSISSKKQNRSQVDRLALHQYFAEIFAPSFAADLPSEKVPSELHRFRNQQFYFCITCPEKPALLDDIYQANPYITEQFVRPFMDMQNNNDGISICFSIGRLVIWGFAGSAAASVSDQRDQVFDAMHAALPSQPSTIRFDEPLPISALRLWLASRLHGINFHILFNETPIVTASAIPADSAVPRQSPGAAFSFDLNNASIDQTKGAIQSLISDLFASRDTVAVKQLFLRLCAFFEAKCNFDILWDTTVVFTGEDGFIEWFWESLEKLRGYSSAHDVSAYSVPVKNAILFMQENFSDDELSIELIAGHIKLSPGRLSHLFKKETGKTVLTVLTDIRIKEAIRLLTTSNHRIYEISEMVGYKTTQYFSQIVSQKTGKRPIDFRNSKEVST